MLDRKLKQLRRLQRRAGGVSRRAKWREGEKGLEGEKAADLLEQLLDFRVLDPAMGSGYFLLAAAEFITRRLADALGRFCKIGRQQLKRHVLGRCLYGVDLDPLAVELAKASLWLDAAVPASRRRNSTSTSARATRSWVFLGKSRFPTPSARPATPVSTWCLAIRLTEASAPARFACDDADYITTHYRSARGNWDLAAIFLEKGLALARAESACGFIVPSRIGSNRDFRVLREMIFAAGGPAMVIDCGPAFDDTAVLASIVIVRRPPVAVDGLPWATGQG